MKNLEQTVNTSFLNKIKNGLNQIKPSTFNKIAVYSLVGIFGAGVGYGCEGDASSNGTNSPNSSARYACINDQCVKDPTGSYAVSNCNGVCIGTIEDNKKYDCIDSQCVEDSNGIYTTSDCDNSCAEDTEKKCWDKTFGGSGNDEIFSIQQTNDGGYIVAGDYTDVENDDSNAWVFKLDSNGNLVWDKKLGEYGEGARSIQQTKDDEYIAAGYTFEDALVLKLNSNGNTVWEKQFGGLWFDSANSIQQTNDGGYVVSGNMGGSGWFSKLDSVGNLEWEKTYEESVNSIQQTKDEGYIIAGLTQSELIYDTGVASGFYVDDAWILKLDSDGELEWDKIFGNEKYDDAVYSILQIKDGGYIATGYTTIDDGDSCMTHPEPAWIIKLDSKGEIEWDKKYGENGCDMYKALSIQQTTDLGYIISGNKNNGGLVFKVDSKGNPEWENNFGVNLLWGGDSLNSIQQTTDGGYIAAGGTSLKGAGEKDGWVVKFDKDGNMDCE